MKLVLCSVCSCHVDLLSALTILRGIAKLLIPQALAIGGQACRHVTRCGRLELLGLGSEGCSHG